MQIQIVLAFAHLVNVNMDRLSVCSSCEVTAVTQPMMAMRYPRSRALQADALPHGLAAMTRGQGNRYTPVRYFVSI